MHEPQIIAVGNVAAKPRLRNAGGVAVADFRIASTPRRRDKASNLWLDGETMWFSVAAWRGLAEHCAASLKKGDRVVVTGRLGSHTWTGDDGIDRNGLEIEAVTVGFDLSRGNASYMRAVAPPPPPQASSEDGWASDGDVDPETGEVSVRSLTAPDAAGAAA